MVLRLFWLFLLCCTAIALEVTLANVSVLFPACVFVAFYVGLAFGLRRGMACSPPRKGQQTRVQSCKKSAAHVNTQSMQPFAHTASLRNPAIYADPPSDQNGQCPTTNFEGMLI